MRRARLRQLGKTTAVEAGDAASAQETGPDSLRKRYFIKLAKSSIDALINVLLLLFVPRTLGPANFGNFNFIRDSLQNVIALSDLNLGAAHINHAARKQDSRIATNVYFTYTLVIGVLVLLSLLVITLSGLNQTIFPGQMAEHLFLGAVLAYLMYLYAALMGWSDSKVATYQFELRSIGVNIALFVALACLYFTDALNLTTYFLQRLALYFAFLVFGAWYLYRKFNLQLRVIDPRQPEAQSVFRDFLSFSHPLITLSVISILFGFFDRWFLQAVYGSVSQGFFSLAYSLSSIAGLFLSPLTPLLMQSIAKADENSDMAGMQSAFAKVKVLYLVGAFLSIFFMFHTNEIIGVIGGDAYSTAGLTLIVMFLYPLHVVYGQFCGGVLIALRKTRLYRNIGIISTVLGVIISYFLLAPKTYPIPGLGLDSLGLALKLVLVQLFSVTLQLYFVCKHFQEKVSHYLLSQILIPIPIALVGVGEWALRREMSITSAGQLENAVSLGVSITLWFIVIGAIMWRFPLFVGLEKSAVDGLVRQLFVRLSIPRVVR